MDYEEIPPSDIIEAECPQEMQSRITSIKGLFATVIQTDNCFMIKKKEFDKEPVSASYGQNPNWEREVCVLWVSETAFVTRHRFDSFSYEFDDSKLVEHLFDVYTDGNHNFSLIAYNLVDAGVAGADIPLELIARLAQFRYYESIAISFGAAPRVGTALSLVPPTTDNIDEGMTVSMEMPSQAVLQALAVYPVHPNVDLEIGFDNWSAYFYLTPNVPRYTLKYLPIQDHPTAWGKFDRDVGTLSRFAPAFARFGFEFPRGFHAKHQWDSLVAPMLLLNWLLQRQGGLPWKDLVGLVIKSINQGGPYFQSNNLTPSNLAAPNATAIFAALHNQPEFRA
jgi:hypothetical protein